MSTIAEFRLPAADTVLARTFERVPEATVELESSVSKTPPCLWISGADPRDIEAAFDVDPTVDSYERVIEADDRHLYDLEFAAGNPLYDDLLADGGALLDVHGHDDHWQVRMRFRDRDQLCRTHDRLVDGGINADLRRVTDMTAATANSRLTPEQQEALAAALEHGYFEIPRQISMEELAAKLGISHQALSERLRRAYETLVDAELQPANSQQ